MKRQFMIVVMAVVFTVSSTAMAKDIEEYELGPAKQSKNTPSNISTEEPPTIEENMPVEKAPVKKNIAAEKKNAAEKKLSAEKKPAPEKNLALVKKPAPVTNDTPQKTGTWQKVKSVFTPSGKPYEGRENHFRFGFIGPGIGYVNKGIGALMTLGIEGEYFFWEHLSAGARIETGTDFKHHTILSFMPRLRYVFDSDKYPRWTAYIQGGAGLAMYEAKHPAADISVPGIGISWQWTDRWSFGAETNLHVLVRRSTTAFGFNLAPTIRYQF